MAIAIAEDKPKLLYKGEYYRGARVVGVDQVKKTVQVVLNGDLVDEFGESSYNTATPVEIPFRTVPYHLIQDYLDNPEKGFCRQYAIRQAKTKELRAMVDRMRADPRRPFLIKGKLVSKISETEALIRCDDIPGIPSASGLIYLSNFQELGPLVDDDPVDYILAELAGQYSYKSAFGTKTLRAYKAIANAKKENVSAAIK